MEDLSKDRLMRLQVEQLEKEKRDMNERLRVIAKRIDHIERACRKDERPLLAKDYAEQQAADRTTFEALQKARVEHSLAAHNDALATKKRLARMLPDFGTHKSTIIAKRQVDYEQKNAVAMEKIQEEKRTRINAYNAKKEAERREREEEEAAARAEEEQRQRQEDGGCISFVRFFYLILTAEQRAKEEEEAAKKREEEDRLAAARRERELERQASAEEAKRKAQREAEAVERRAAQRQQQPSTDPWRRAAAPATPPARATPPRAESPAPSPVSATPSGKYKPPMPSSQRPENHAPATGPASSAPAPKYKPPGASGGGGWRQREAEKAAQKQAASPAVSNAPLPETKDDGFERPSKVWKPRRLQGQL